MLLIGAGTLQGPPILVTQQEQTAFPAVGTPPDIFSVPVTPRLMGIGAGWPGGPPILVMQQRFPAEGQWPDTMNVLTPPRMMGLGISQGGPPILVTQSPYVPVEVVVSVDTPITHPLVKFRLAKVGPVLLAHQQTQSQTGLRTFVVAADGALTTASALIQMAQTAISGALTVAGTIVRAPAVIVHGTLTTASTLVRAISSKVSGGLTAAGGLTRKISTAMTGALVTASTLDAMRIAKLAVPAVVQLVTKAITIAWDGIIRGKSEVSIHDDEPQH